VLASGRDSNDLGGDRYWVEVQYMHDGEPVTARVTLGRQDQQRCQERRHVELTYAPGRPHIVTFDRTK
jgi:hypothetical protein